MVRIEIQRPSSSAEKFHWCNGDSFSWRQVPFSRTSTAYSPEASRHVFANRRKKHSTSYGVNSFHTTNPHASLVAPRHTHILDTYTSFPPTPPAQGAHTDSRGQQPQSTFVKMPPNPEPQTTPRLRLLSTAPSSGISSTRQPTAHDEIATQPT